MPVCFLACRGGDRLAIVGPNGTGKSTLLKVIANNEQHDSGFVSRNKGASIGYLAQDPNLPDDMIVLQAVLQADSDMTRACQEYQRALAGDQQGCFCQRMMSTSRFGLQAAAEFQNAD